MRKSALLILTFLCIGLLSGCVYRTTISQGNLIKQKDLEQAEIGMTKSQIRFLLGTPMIDDPFSKDRWDYVYYVKVGRADTVGKRWVSILFADDAVVEIRNDQDLAPTL